MSKGPGADGGLECYLVNSNDNERGWQAKFVFNWDDAAKQLTESYDRALSTHPNMNVFVACVPFDLSDGRQASKSTGKKSKSAKDKYDDWKKKRIAAAKKLSRNIEIEFWGAAEIRHKLLTGKAPQARIRYWFDNNLLTDDMLQKLFRRTASALGPRYVAEHHVDLPIKRRIDAICRNPSWRKRVEKALKELTSTIDRFQAMLQDPVYSSASSKAQLTEAAEKLEKASLAWEVWKADRRSTLPVEPMSCALLAAIESCRSNSSPEVSEDIHPTIRYGLETIAKLAKQLQRCFASYRDIIGDDNCLLITGEGGIGKSHLLASAVKAQLDAGLPGILVLAGGFSADTPLWTALSNALEENSLRDPTILLDSLDTASSAKGEKALICIDAINEGAGFRRWSGEALSFIQRASEYENIAVVLSCRTPALPVVLPTRPIKGLIEIQHPGFGRTGGRAAEAYLNDRGLSRPPLSRPTKEFDNPLLLKLVCDAVIADGLSQIPEDLNHLWEFFTFALNSVSTGVNITLGLDPLLEHPRKALKAFARKALEGYGWVNYQEAHAICAEIHATSGGSQLSLLQALIGSGILTQSIVRHGGKEKNVVRFTFERLGDFIAASDLLDEGLKNKVLQTTSRLGQIISKNAANSSTILPSIVLILADHYGLEVVDLKPDILTNLNWLHAFEESVARRRPDALSSRTLKLAKANLKEEHIFAIAISRLGQDGSQLTPDWLDKELRGRNMIERDLTWSNYLLQDYGQLNRSAMDLIVWTETANLSGISDKVIRDLFRLLGWLLTTSHREVRDRATKCLVRIIAHDLKVGVSLIEWAQSLGDLYITERVYVSIYGAALQSPNDEGLKELAYAVYDAVFKNNTPSLNLLLRDHATALLHFAETKSVLDTSKLLFPYLGPYADPGPLEYVPKDWAPLDYENEEKWSDQVESSLGEMGDFGNKIVRHFVTQWSPAKLGIKSLPTGRQLFDTWHSEAVLGDSRMSEAWEKFDTFILQWNADGRANDYQFGDDWKQALEAFNNEIGESAYSEFERRALNYTRRCLHRSDTDSQPADFDEDWARRWLWKRVRDFGWNPKEFAEIDRPIGGGCHDHRVERLGKKYQWLALYELGARLQDHYAFIPNGWADDRTKPGQYAHMDGVGGLRNIDPTLLRRETHCDGWTQWPSTWWAPLTPKLTSMRPREQLDWLHSSRDYIQGEDLITIRDPRDGSDWLTLSGFIRASKSLDDKSLGSETWCRTQCFVVPSDQAAAALVELGQHILINPDDPVRAEIPDWMYVGEIGVKPSVGDAGKERAPFRYEGLGDIWATTVEYLRESTTYDHSITSNIGVEVPLPWLSNLCDASFSDGLRISYVDSDERTLFFDPSVSFEGPSTCLVRRDIFLKSLSNAKLTPIWVEAGEKRIFGNDSYGGRIAFTRLYTLNNEEWIVRKKIEKKYPDEIQLRKFLSDESKVSQTDVKKWSRERPIDIPKQVVEAGLSLEAVKKIQEELLGLKITGGDNVSKE